MQVVSNIFKRHAIIIDLLLPLYVYIITPKVFLTQHISYLPFRFVFTLHNEMFIEAVVVVIVWQLD